MDDKKRLVKEWADKNMVGFRNAKHLDSNSQSVGLREKTIAPMLVYWGISKREFRKIWEELSKESKQGMGVYLSSHALGYWVLPLVGNYFEVEAARHAVAESRSRAANLFERASAQEKALESIKQKELFAMGV